VWANNNHLAPTHESITSTQTKKTSFARELESTYPFNANSAIYKSVHKPFISSYPPHFTFNHLYADSDLSNVDPQNFYNICEYKCWSRGFLNYEKVKKHLQYLKKESMDFLYWMARAHMLHIHKSLGLEKQNPNYCSLYILLTEEKGDSKEYAQHQHHSVLWS